MSTSTYRKLAEAYRHADIGSLGGTADLDKHLAILGQGALEGRLDVGVRLALRETKAMSETHPWRDTCSMNDTYLATKMQAARG